MSKNLATYSQEGEQTALIADLLMLTRLLPTFFEDIEPGVWQQRGKHVRASEWTLHQTVAHLAAAAEFYRSALRLALAHETLVTPDFQQRRDLPAVNQQEIQKRQRLQPPELIGTLKQALVDTVEIAQQLTPEQCSWPVKVPVFNRPLTLFELLEMQVTHPAMVHAAQIARPAGKAPLWREYEALVLHRMLTRFFRLMSLVYWPERGGNLRATVQFLVAGTAGGEWYIDISPEDCQSYEGRASKPRLTLWAANADTLCSLFTNQIRLGQALLHRKLSVRGDLLLALRLASLFSPT